MSWEFVKLGDISTVNAGNSAPQDEKLFVNGVHNFYRTSDVGKIKVGAILDSADKLNDAGIQGLRKFSVGTILFPKSGASTFLNHRVMIKKDGFVSSHLATIKANNEIVLDKFLFYFLTTIDAKNLVQDSNYPSLKTSAIENVDVPLPPLSTQQKIVEKLDAIFAEIERATAATEANVKNAEAFFQSYLTEVFERGGEDWEAETIGNLCSELFAGGDVPKDRMSKSLSGEFSIPIFTNGEKDKGLYGFTDKPRVVKPSLTISARGTIGYSELRNEPFYPAIRLIVATPNENVVDINYLNYAIKSIKFTHSGASIPQLTVPMIKNYAIKYPKSTATQSDIVSKFSGLSHEIQKIKRLSSMKLSQLAHLKQSILKQAFSGELIKE